MPPMYTQRKRLRSALRRHGAVKFPRDCDDPFENSITDSSKLHDACDERNYDEAYLTWKDSRCENRYARQKYFDRVIKSPGLENKRFNE